MILPKDPRELAEAILSRSICAVQVGAVIEDSHGILSWGWNSVGSGLGMHAEEHAIVRGNKARLEGSTIYVAARRSRTTKFITAKPCFNCQRLIDTWGLKVEYLDGERGWR